MAQAGFRSLLAFWLGGAGTINVSAHGKGVGGRKHVSNIIRTIITAELQKRMELETRLRLQDQAFKMRKAQEAIYQVQAVRNRQILNDAITGVFLAEV